MIYRAVPLMLAGLAGLTSAQTCLVANPSFEVGSGLDGWNVLYDAALQGDLLAHGRRAVVVRTPGGDAWSISAVWQPQDAGPGTVFEGAVRVGHASSDPLTGLARGIVNVEWRDATGALIGYESFDVLSADDPTDRLLRRAFVTPPAPAGTASARLLLGTLQSPAGETGATVFDNVELHEPGYDGLQWGDFPGGRAVEFAGYTWRVKGPGLHGPGPNWFSDSASSVSVTPDGLRLAINDTPTGWTSAEVVIEDVLGYGDYIFTTRGRVDAFADNAVLGLFLWQYPSCYDVANRWNQHNEIDVEISRWGDPNNMNAQFVVQPYDEPGNLERFDIGYADDSLISYAFRWLPSRIEFRAWLGGPSDESPATMLRSWTYPGDHLPTPEQPRVHINLWTIGEGGPSDGQPRSVTIADFEFRAMGDADWNGVLDFRDMVVFLERLDSQQPAADLNNDGQFDARDAVLFITEGLASVGSP